MKQSNSDQRQQPLRIEMGKPAVYMFCVTMTDCTFKHLLVVGFSSVCCASQRRIVLSNIVVGFSSVCCASQRISYFQTSSFRGWVQQCMLCFATHIVLSNIFISWLGSAVYVVLRNAYRTFEHLYLVMHMVRISF